MNQDRSLFFMTWIMCYPTHSPLFLPFFFSSSFLNVQLLVLTSAWLPGARVLLHLSQRRQGRCQSLPSDVTFSATVINTQHTRACETQWQPAFFLASHRFTASPLFLLTEIHLLAAAGAQVGLSGKRGDAASCRHITDALQCWKWFNTSPVIFPVGCEMC